MDRPPIAPRSAVGIALLVSVPVWLALAWRFDFVCDDAYISFRYARHLAEGEGLTFNLGQRPPVEGYSNFLWVLWCTVSERLGWDVATWSRVSSAAASVCLLALVLDAARRALRLRLAGLVATGLFLVTLPPFAMWTTSGLETMATALALFLAWERLLADPERPHGFAAGLACLAAALLRADGAVFALLVLAGGALAWIVRGRPTALARAGAIAATILVVGVAAHVAWRVSYYGDYLPNTARVKAGFSLTRLDRGWRYLVSFLLSVPSLALLLAVSLRRFPRSLAHVWIPIAVLTAATCAYSVWVGGDFMPFGRFLFPAIPFLALLFALHWSDLESGGVGRRVVAVALGVLAPTLSVLACYDVNPVPESVQRRFHFRLDRKWSTEVGRWSEMGRNEQRWVLVGKALALHTKLGESMIIGGIGAMSYFNELYIYDNYGLVTPEVVAQGKIRPMKSPGHDMKVNSDFFFPPPHGKFHHKPTYLGATLVASPSVEAATEDLWWADPLPEEWGAGHPWHELVDVEEYPLSEEEGFPAGAILLLIRFKWAPR